MALDPKGAALALHRFGFGPRPGSINAIASDPRGALLAELDRPKAGQILAAAGLMTSGAANRATFEFFAERNAKARVAQMRAEEAKRVAAEAGTAMMEAKPEMAADAAKSPDNKSSDNKSPDNKSPDNQMADNKTPDNKPPAARPPAPPPETVPQQIFFAEARARFDAAINSEVGFVERLVWFWSNHFCVNADDTVMAGAYEREAIRPHVLGRFVDLLQAAEGHPAMLLYLTNTLSMGPNSVAGINRTRGLNENLAREILELHTLGVRTGYTQEDVTNFAKVITGWTILPTDTNPDHGGEFQFHHRLHEPGPQTVMGKSYRDNGVEQGRAVLTDLARHPATAKHIATKLARHFVADDPSPALVARLEQRFNETEGDLWEVSKALAAAPEAWSEERVKIKLPSEWIVTYMRAARFMGDIRAMNGSMNRLGQPLWRPPAPRGFPDLNATWLDGLSHRLDIANTFSQNNAERLDASTMLDTALGPLASAETRRAVARAESKPQALTLVLMAPELQWR
jgi:uncharacterized protein (DUF1800 family)